jgi:hypothetical protein
MICGPSGPPTMSGDETTAAGTPAAWLLTMTEPSGPWMTVDATGTGPATRTCGLASGAGTA